MIEQMLRDTFARHEHLASAAQPLRERIDMLARRRRRRGWVLRCAAAALALLALVGAGWTAAREVGQSLPQPPADSLLPGRPAGPITVLVLGVDRRAGAPEPVRADTIMLAHLPAATDRGYLISIPRDARLGGEKLSGVYATGGASGIRQAVSTLTGIRLDGVVEVEFAGLVKVTDAVGGVDLCVDRKVVSEHIGYDAQGRYRHPRDGGTPVVYEPGCRRFSGAQALDYLRQRRSLPDGDLGRQRHNRQYVKALLNRLTGMDLRRLTAVLDAAGEAVRLDIDGYPLAQLTLAVGDLTPDRVASIGTPADPEGHLTPDAGDLWTALRRGRLAQWAAAHPQHVDP